MRRNAVLVAFFSFANIGGCVVLPPPAPNDLRFVGVELIDTTILSMKERHDVGKQSCNKTPRELLRARFSSSSDLIEHRREWANPRVKATKCSELEDLGRLTRDPKGGFVASGSIGMAASSVYWNTLDVFDSATDLGPRDAAPFIYHYYLDIQCPSYPPRLSGYDLTQLAEDLCFRITSAEMLRFGAKTNVVIIPKEAIAAALAKASPWRTHHH